MNTRTFLLLGLFGLAGIVSCHASLGETYDQCVVRYGPSSPPKGYIDPNTAAGVNYHFTKGDFAFDVLFRKDVDTLEFITKKDQAQFTDQEKASLLMAEGGEWKETKTDADGSGQHWVRSDGALASYLSEAPAMLIIPNGGASRESAFDFHSYLLVELAVFGIMMGMAFVGGCYLLRRWEAKES